MAGIKRKTSVPSASETKVKNKKVKVEKPAAKRTSKHEVKPAKKRPKVDDDSSGDLDESDTSEQENGFYGFSAAKHEETVGSNVDDSEDADQDTAVSTGKAHKRKTGAEAVKNGKKLNKEDSESKLAELNGLSSLSFSQHQLTESSKLVTRSARETESPR